MKDKINIHKANLEVVAGRIDQLPHNDIPEIAFAGKSNVGKSSMINALLNRKNFARTSSEPGKTRTINFYNIDDKLYIVDLPGYGYAKVSKEKKEEFSRLINEYLNSSESLKAIVMLIDIRHSVSNNDMIMYNYILECGYTPIIVLTKSDKLSSNEMLKNISMIKKELNIKGTQIIPFSAVKKTGVGELWKVIEEVVYET